MPLEKYRKMRDFSKTHEPKGSDGNLESHSTEVKKESGKNHSLSFVVQEHHASRLHWDFRLEMNGVLRSWAVPKGPPLDEGVKRLAVETEDHPLEYGSFEGEISEGAYGAGQVYIWDRGTYESEEVKENKLVFELKGGKMQGRYCLIKLARGSGKEWLLFKTKPKEVRQDG